VRSSHTVAGLSVSAAPLETTLSGEGSSGGPHQQRSMLGKDRNESTKARDICVLLTATPNLLAVEALEVKLGLSIRETGQAGAGMSPVAGEARRQSATDA